MASKFELMMEAEKRGILPDDQKGLLAEARKRGLVAADERRPPRLGTQALMQGVTFGLSDEIAGVAGATADFTKALARGEGFRGAVEAGKQGYQRAAAQERGEIAEFKRERPVLGTGLELAGGIGTGVATGTAALGAKALSRVPTAVKMAGIGATEGAVAGAGFADGGLEERAKGAATGAATGAVLGATVPAAIAGARVVGGKVAEAFKTPATKAMQKVAQAVARDDMTPGRVADRVATMGDKATIADAGGRHVQGLAAAATRQPGGAGNRAEIILNQRQLGQSGRITEHAKRLIGMGDDFSTVADDLVAVRATKAAPLYEKAYATPIEMTDELMGIVNRPAFRSAFRNARTIALNEGDDIPELLIRGADGKEVVNTAALRETRVWDYVKRGLDDVIERAKEPITGKIRTDQGRALVGLKQQMMKELDRVNPDFAAARKEFAGYSESLNALKQGRDFLKGDVDLTVKQLKALSDSDKEFFRIGVIQGIKDKVDTAADTANAVRRIFGNQKLREKMAAVFPDRKAFLEFQKSMISEAKFATTRQKVLGGSQTAERAAESAELSTPLGSVGAIIGSDLPVGGHALVRSGVFRRAFQGAGDKLFGADRAATAKEIGQRLLSTDPTANAATIEEINRIMLGRQLAGQRGRAIGQGAVGGAITGTQQR